MTREEFESLQVGDKVVHAFGGVGVVTEKDDQTYTVKSKDFEIEHGVDEVSFAWNEGYVLKSLPFFLKNFPELTPIYHQPHKSNKTPRTPKKDAKKKAKAKRRMQNKSRNK